MFWTLRCCARAASTGRLWCLCQCGLDAGKFQKLGGKIQRGVRIVDPTGTAKTLTAKAIPGEAGVQIFTILGSVVG